MYGDIIKQYHYYIILYGHDFNSLLISFVSPSFSVFTDLGKYEQQAMKICHRS